MRLTRRQQEILDFLRDHAEQLAHPPTLDELCAMLGLRSRGSLHKHVQALVAAGFVEPMDGQHRGIRLILQEPTEEGIPLLGTIAAGQPIEAVPQPEFMQVPAQLRTDRPCYVLKVRGDSMREAGILDGDYVVIEQRDTARNGEIVVALVRGEEVTLKRILQEPKRTILYPENSSMAALQLDPNEVQIQGVLVGQMRSYLLKCWVLCGQPGARSGPLIVRRKRALTMNACVSLAFKPLCRMLWTSFCTMCEAS